MNDYEFLLEDRIAKIQAINKEFDLEHNAYLSFSGGKDSTILHYLLDIALPNNRIPRVFINTGIEYLDIVKFTKELAKNDDRFVLVAPSKNIKSTLEEYGYPFKSKEHSKKLLEYKRGSRSKSNLSYKTGIRILPNGEETKPFALCPKILQYQYEDDFPLKISHLCCTKMKKDPAHKWAKENNKSIYMTGMRSSEGGQRRKGKCILLDKDKLKAFHPLMPIDEIWEDQFIQSNNIKLCRLYYPPFNFTRTGCKGCPFALDIQRQLDVMKELLPSEKTQCENIWKPVYDEYRRLGYRLRKIDNHNQTSIYDFIKEKK